MRLDILVRLDKTQYRLLIGVINKSKTVNKLLFWALQFVANEGYFVFVVIFW